MDDYQVELEVYEGPLELLLKLIKRQEIAATAVSVSQIIDQFLDYASSREFTDVEEGSRFMVMAATLLAVKAQLLLPRPEEDGTSPEETCAPWEDDHPGFDYAEEYLSIQAAASTLEQRAEEWRLFHKRPPLPQSPEVNPRVVSQLDVSLLITAFKRVLERHVPPEPYAVTVPEHNLWEKVELVLTVLTEQPQGVLFSRLFHPAAAREDLIITFLAILELAYQGKITVRQADEGEDILIAPAG